MSSRSSPAPISSLTAPAAFAGEHGLEANSVADLLARDDIDIVINLTIPAVHADVSLQIIKAGKHVYSEKPLGDQPRRRREGDPSL